MLLSIIIVSYNTSALTLDAVKSADENIQNSSILKGKSEIIIIDNNSSDNSVAALSQLKSSLKTALTLIENKENTGFAVANNQGIERAKGEYVLLLNSDTIVQPGALEILIKTFIKNPEEESTEALSSYSGKLDNIGIVAAMLLNPDKTLQPQGGDLPSLVSVFNQLFFIDDIPLLGKLLPSTQHTGKNTRYELSSDSLISMGWVGGTAMLISKKVVREIGTLDPAIFMYGEDVEYCLRAHNHLFDVVIQPKAHVVHWGSKSGSSQRAIEGEFKSFLYIWSKHKPHWQIPLMSGMLKLACFVRYVVFSTIGNNKERATVYRQLLHTL